MELPLYDILIGENQDNGMFRISLVDKPAIGETFLAFNDMPKLKFSNEEKRQVVGPLLIPDMPIYRRNNEIGEYYVRFSAETIQQILYKYSKDGFFNIFNLEHQYDTSAVTMLEIWVKESDIDKSDEYGFDLPVGTLFMKAQVEDENLWSAIKDGEFNGFSIEIKADIKKANNQMSDFKFGEAFGEHKAAVKNEIASLASQVEIVKDDNLQMLEMLAQISKEIAELRLSMAPAVVEEPVVEEPAVELSEQTEETPSEVVAEEPVEEVQEQVEEVLSEEEEVSEEQAELELSAQQEEVSEVEEPKVLEFSSISESKIELINKFFNR